ncbi:MAG: nitroreductase family deazaflavin-dependent oxidoreductase [Acidimicrobiia bacterium]
MPLPRRLAVFNKKATNKVALHVAGWAPGFAIVCHVGRRTGNSYRTPVNVFRQGDAFLFALTYGEGSWVRNVMAADGCSIRTRRRVIELTAPRLFTDPARRDVPIPARWILGLVHVDEFLSLRRAPTQSNLSSS